MKYSRHFVELGFESGFGERIAEIIDEVNIEVTLFQVDLYISLTKATEHELKLGEMIRGVIFGVE